MGEDRHVRFTAFPTEVHAKKSSITSRAYAIVKLNTGHFWTIPANPYWYHKICEVLDSLGCPIPDTLDVVEFARHLTQLKPPLTFEWRIHKLPLRGVEGDATQYYPQVHLVS